MDAAEEKRQMEMMENERTKVDDLCDQITWENTKESRWGSDGEAGHMFMSVIVALLPAMRSVGVYVCVCVRVLKEGAQLCTWESSKGEGRRVGRQAQTNPRVSVA